MTESIEQESDKQAKERMMKDMLRIVYKAADNWKFEDKNISITEDICDALIRAGYRKVK
jgi:hypothetical protein